MRSEGLKVKEVQKLRYHVAYWIPQTVIRQLSDYCAGMHGLDVSSCRPPKYVSYSNGVSTYLPNGASYRNHRINVHTFLD